MTPQYYRIIMSNNQNEKLQVALHKVEMYEGLFEANAAVTSSLDKDEVLNLVMTKAQELLNSEAASIFLLDLETDELVLAVSTNLAPNAVAEIRFSKGLGVSGWVAENGLPVITADISKDPRFYAGVQDSTGFHTSSYMCVPLMTNDKIIGTAQVLNRRDGGTFTKDELHIMEGFARQATIAIENARLHEEELEKKRMEEELELAHKIQLDLLPPGPPKIDGYDISGVSFPSRWVGGDYYDFVPFGENELNLIIADVCGKGIPAALMMSSIQAVLHALAGQKLPLNDVVRNLNLYLCRNSPQDKFATCFTGVLNSENHRFSYINCGHNHPFLFRKGGRIEPLREGGLILGVIEETDFSAGSVQIEPGDLLILYTDGVTEVHNPKREMYGEHRLVRAINEARSMNTEDIIKKIYDEINEFAYKGIMEDDVTMVCLKREE